MSDSALALYDLDLLDQDALQVFQQTTGIQLEEIFRLGEIAYQLGSLQQVSRVSLRLTSNRNVLVYQDIIPHSRWDHIDGTMVQSPQDSLQRYTSGVTYSNHSCGIDTFLFVAIAIDAGRIQADQITMGAELQLPAPAQLLRSIVRQQWGLLSSDHHRGLRDLLRHSLHTYNPESFPLGKYHEYTDLFSAMFSSLPQLVCTICNGYYCCDNRLRVPKGSLPQTILGLQLALEDSSESVQKGLNRLLARHQVLGSNSKQCDNEDDCTREVFQQILVLDRLPPILPVIWAASLQDGLRAQVFEDLNITYQKYRSKAIIGYQVLGVLLFQQARRHFFIRWRFGEKIIQYDSILNNGQAIQVTDWIDSLELDKTLLCLVFYRRRE